MKRRNAFALARRLHVLQVLLAVLLTVAINVAAVALSQRYPLRLDLTANGRYELSEENREFLAALDKQIHFYVLADQEEYARASTYTTYAATLLAQYPLYADVEVTYVDFAADPTFASRYPDLELAQNGIVVECEDRAVALETSDLFEYSYSAQNEIQVSAVGEARLASAIASVLNPVRAHATVLVDNDAQPVEAFCEVLSANGFAVSQGSLALGNIDAECDMLILVAPMSDFTPEQVQALEAWLVNDGQYGRTLFYAADVSQPELPNLEGFLREWGVSVDDGAVFETSAERTSQNQPFFATVEIVEEALAEEFAQQSMPIIAPMARPLTVRFSFQESYTTQTILTFSETSGVRPSDATQDFSAEDAQRRGPIPALVCATLAPDGERASRIYLSGSASLLDSMILEGNAFLNRRFLTALLSQTAQGRSLPNFVGKQISDERVYIPSSTANALGIALAIALPLALVAAGLVFFLRRRRL